MYVYWSCMCVCFKKIVIKTHHCIEVGLFRWTIYPHREFEPFIAGGVATAVGIVAAIAVAAMDGVDRVLYD